MIDPDYIQTVQKGEIKWHMRLMLMDWMMEVSDEFHIQRETFQLASLYTDLYLSRCICPIEKL
jgi:cyclin A